MVLSIVSEIWRGCSVCWERVQGGFEQDEKVLLPGAALSVKTCHSTELPWAGVDGMRNGRTGELNKCLDLVKREVKMQMKVVGETI